MNKIIEEFLNTFAWSQDEKDRTELRFKYVNLKNAFRDEGEREMGWLWHVTFENILIPSKVHKGNFLTSFGVGETQEEAIEDLASRLKDYRLRETA